MTGCGGAGLGRAAMAVRTACHLVGMPGGGSMLPTRRFAGAGLRARLSQAMTGGLKGVGRVRRFQGRLFQIHGYAARIAA